MAVFFGQLEQWLMALAGEPLTLKMFLGLEALCFILLVALLTVLAFTVFLEYCREPSVFRFLFGVAIVASAAMGFVTLTLSPVLVGAGLVLLAHTSGVPLSGEMRVSCATS